MKKSFAIILGTTMLCVLLMGNVGYGFNQDDLNSLGATNLCPRCDLRGADLSGMILKVADLNAANLSGAKLIGTDLSNADVDGADLSSADLSAANLKGTDLSSADLSGANLTGANLAMTTLDGAKLDNATWTEGQHCKPGSIEKCIQ
jgi:uncharacterized protein YjbI with pentapeptide repeats